MTTYLASFAIAFAATGTIAILARFAIGLLAPLKPARFGAFCLACGFAIARHSGEAPIGPEAAVLASAAAGAAVALAALWYWWFKRGEKEHSLR
jgi:hypothetical protein